MRWIGMAVAAMLIGGNASAGEYDPLARVGAEAPAPLDLEVVDEARDRTVPIRVYPPAGAEGPAPVVLFSHGLGGSRGGSPYLGKHWAARGYLAVFLQHPGSDSGVWRGKVAAERTEALRGEASGANLLLRIGDVKAVLDALERWDGEQGHPLAGKADLGRVGMSGHSFGAVTTQHVSGQRAGRVGRSAADPRIRAAVIMSPSSPRLGDPRAAFGEVSTPWLLMTGTKDVAAIGGETVESRLAVYPALPEGGKYELVLEGGQHSAFSERPLPGDSGGRDPNDHRAILALSTAFWDAYLKGDEAARLWLDGEGARGVLGEKDRWRRK